MAEVMNISGLIKKIEKTITEKVHENYPHDWDENIITREIVREFRNNYKRIDLIDRKSAKTIIEWSAYKQTGKVENFLGDIGILIKVHLKNGISLEGIALIEAKRRYEDAGHFNAMDMDQIERILNNAPHSMVLLYDYQPIDHNHMILPWVHYRNTYAVTLPSYIVDQTKDNTVKLYDFSIPFSYQLCMRYFNGLDLDFSKENIDKVKGFADKKPKFVLKINITQGDHKDVDDGIEINADAYTDEF
jgi:hypothetical protein